VYVFVAKVGDGYRVHDGAGAFRSAWLHGRDRSLITNALKVEYDRFHVRLSEDDSNVGEVESADWLPSMILSIANASALGAQRAVDKVVGAAEEALIEKIDKALTNRFGESHFKRNVERIGASGGKRHFDFALQAPRSDLEILINGVLPSPISVSSKFVSLSDGPGDRGHKFAVYDKILASADATLLGQVASVVHLPGLAPAAERLLA